MANSDYLYATQCAGKVYSVCVASIVAYYAYETIFNGGQFSHAIKPLSLVFGTVFFASSIAGSLAKRSKIPWSSLKFYAAIIIITTTVLPFIY